MEHVIFISYSCEAPSAEQEWGKKKGSLLDVVASRVVLSPHNLKNVPVGVSTSTAELPLDSVGAATPPQKTQQDLPLKMDIKN